MTTAYPLQWPDGWPRTPSGQIRDGRDRFARSSRKFGSNSRAVWTFADARDKLLEELRQLGAKNIVLSSNFELNRWGTASEGKRRPADQGIAVYFTRDGEPLAMARDAFDRAEENMRSLALAIEAMRQLDRHGGSTMMRRAFAGFVAIPPPDDCWVVLGLKPGAGAGDIQAAYRKRAQAMHPDRPGGDERLMTALNRARDEAMQKAGQ